jgi:hypothetical protein
MQALIRHQQDLWCNQQATHCLSSPSGLLLLWLLLLLWRAQRCVAIAAER